MANIRVDLDSPVYHGQNLTFKSPADCSQVTGLIVYYSDGSTTTSKIFQFADAHGNNVGDIDNLFADNVLVKVILDTELDRAYVQNADTNAYLEARFEELENKASNIVITKDDDPEDVDFWIDEDDESTVEDAHINNKDNPHEVTLAQVKGSNKNLLNNWYFADPIDQRGGYVVPPGAKVYDAIGGNVVGTTDNYYTAQRDAVSLSWGSIYISGATHYIEWANAVRGYTGVGYTIDGWIHPELSAKVITIKSDGVVLTAQSSSIRQAIEQSLADILDGNIITFSALIVQNGNTRLAHGSLRYNKNEHQQYFVLDNKPDADFRLFYDDVRFCVWSETAGTIVKAVKLELGTEQTLAHQDSNGNWVLNEIPNYHEELLKCIQSTADPEDTFANKVIATGHTCNCNILDNWYFGNPVDQRGGLVVPPGVWYYDTPTFNVGYAPTGEYYVATKYSDTAYTITLPAGEVVFVHAEDVVRGYTGVGYGIDRWFICPDGTGLGEASLVVAENEIVFEAHSVIPYFCQPVGDKIRGETVTLSVLGADGRLSTSTGYVPESGVVDGIARVLPVQGLALDITEVLGNICFRFFAYEPGVYRLKAVKLELGTEQTLAHLENGEWVLNEIPNYAEEEFKCIHSTADSSDTYANMAVGGMELLWENASPSSEFAAQDVALDLTAFSHVAVLFRWNSGSTEVGVPVQFFEKGVRATATAFGYSATELQARVVTVSDTAVKFGQAGYWLRGSTTSNMTTTNSVMMPWRIYGIKGVS